MVSQISEAFANSDPVAVSNVINAVSSHSIPSIAQCLFLRGPESRRLSEHSQDVRSVSRGLLGVDGDDNSLCSDPTALRKIGDVHV